MMHMVMEETMTTLAMEEDMTMVMELEVMVVITWEDMVMTMAAMVMLHTVVSSSMAVVRCLHRGEAVVLPVAGRTSDITIYYYKLYTQPNTCSLALSSWNMGILCRKKWKTI